MIESLKARVFITLAVVAMALIWITPNFVDMKDKWWFSKEKLVYGLDIQGGLHLVMQVDVKGVLEEKTARQIKVLQSEMGTNKIPFTSVEQSETVGTEITVTVPSSSDTAAVEKYIEEKMSHELQVIEISGNKLRVRYLDAAVANYKSQIIDQAIEVIRNRVDGIGVAEPSITSQGDDRILVQLPGFENASRAKELINRTARLDFRVVNNEFGDEKLNQLVSDAETKGNYKLGEENLQYDQYKQKVNEDLKGSLPEGWRVVFEKSKQAKNLEAGKVAYLVKEGATLTGDMLEDAYVGRGQYGEPEVAFRFNVEGRRLFADLTGENIGGRMAIVLDDVIKSVATIRVKIDSESAKIELGRTSRDEALKEASFIATALRAGALPAKLVQLEERTVGPTLGADSIAKGKKAGLIGGALVLLFMLIYYRKLGFVADMALALNILLILAILTSLEATLTLPGVAGIVLTVGMAVDANVIIFERIREEIQKGSGVKAAVRDGFGHAFSAIFDGNITTAAVCVVLMYFGTGPIRGFAVTLICGIITSMFTAIFVSRTILEVLMNKFNMTKLFAK